MAAEDKEVARLVERLREPSGKLRVTTNSKLTVITIY